MQLIVNVYCPAPSVAKKAFELLYHLHLTSE